MSADKPQWNDQSTSGFSVNFSDISLIYQLAKGRAANLGELLPIEAKIDSIFIATNNKQPLSLAIAEGNLIVNDSIVKKVRIEISSGYSSEGGEWIEIVGEIIPADETVAEAFAKNIPQMKENLEKITETKWNITGNEIDENKRLPLHVSLAKKDPDDPEDFSIIFIGTPEPLINKTDFIQESQRFQEVFSHVVSHVYKSVGLETPNLKLNIESNI